MTAGFPSHLRVWTRLAVVSVLVLSSLSHDPRRTAAQAPTDHEVKAAYVYNFGRFVSWPTSAMGSQFEICVFGRDPIGAVIDRTVRGERLGSRPVTMRVVANLTEAPGCQVLVVSASEERQLESHLARIGKRPILTVSDIPRFVARGGMIEFVNEGSRVRFLVDPARAEAAGLTLSSELLRVARLVKPPTGGPEGR